jgi:hypothetical protein
MGAQERVMLVVALGLLLSAVFYLVNLFLSERKRGLDPRYKSGVDNHEQLKEVLERDKGKFYFVLSLAVGLFPTILLITLDLVHE